MQVRVVPVTPFEQNCSILLCERTGRAAVVDPGGDLPRIRAALNELGAEPERILVTHGHLDHVGGVAALAAELDLPVEGPHEADRFWLEALPEQAAMFGFPPAEPFTPDRWLAQGDTVHFGEQTLSVRHCPGHTPGHVVFHSAAARLVIVGDVLFKGSIGRTDFPRGDLDTLLRAIREQLLTLPDDTIVYPGHGPTTTIGAERRTNPYLA